VNVNRSTPIYGLTGGIASGKTTALQTFQDLGIDTIDADHVARLVIAPASEGAKALEQAIGADFFDAGSLDRSKLRDAMYLDSELKRAVEAVIHPRVKAQIAAWKAQSTDAPYRILCSPLLLETGQDAELDGVIVIDTDPSLQIDRAAARDRRGREDIAKIIANQWSRVDRLAKADHVVDNAGTTAQFQRNILALHERLMA